MEVEKNEEGTVVNEIVNEDTPIIEEQPENEKPVIKVKRPRTEKQKEALKKMLEKRREIAVVQRAERKERRAPLWHRLLNTQQKEIDELKGVIDKLKEQSITPKESQTVEDDEVEEPVYGLKNDIYYPPPVVRQPVYKEVRPMRNFTPNDKLSLLRHLV